MDEPDEEADMLFSAEDVLGMLTLQLWKRSNEALNQEEVMSIDDLQKDFWYKMLMMQGWRQLVR